MSLIPPAPRTPQHHRRVHYHGYERTDGLRDIEGELHDSKMHDAPAFLTGGIRRAGEPIHHMWLRVTVNHELVVQTIEVAMDTHPLKDCPQSEPALQALVGCSMARGWRKAIQQHLGGVASCTHLRELLFNLATAAFQTLPAAFGTVPDNEPPRHLGQCKGWAFDGNGVKEYFPQFYSRTALAYARTPHSVTP